MAQPENSKPRTSFKDKTKRMIQIQKIVLLCGCIFLVQCTTSTHKNAHTNTKQPQQFTPTTNQHSAENSLDWNGTYTGVLPCADCSGIQTSLQLNLDLTYKLSQIYLGKNQGKPFEESGDFIWIQNGQTIVLTAGKNELKQFKVVENAVWLLNKKGEIITGDLAEYYHLKKQ